MQEERYDEGIEDVDILVVGAGLAGLVAGRDLALKGYKVLVMEANKRVGGRVYSQMFPDTDVTVDLGAEWVCRDQHKETLVELQRYDLQASDPKNEARTAYSFKLPGYVFK